MRKTGYYEKGEGVSEGEKRGSCFIECYAIGPDSADLVSFTNKGRALTHSQTHAHGAYGHLHTHLT